MLVFGQRRCPSPECLAHVFVVMDGSTSEREAAILNAYPPELIDFDSSDLPERVVEAIEEAITCHANECYSAAAMMIRKALEEVCRDQGAGGDTLKDRIKAMSRSVVIPPDMFSGLDNLRMLGNDAAHVDSQGFTAVGKNEVEIALNVTNLILAAVYQYRSALESLNDLRNDTSDAP